MNTRTIRNVSEYLGMNVAPFKGTPCRNMAVYGIGKNSIIYCMHKDLPDTCIYPTRCEECKFKAEPES